MPAFCLNPGHLKSLNKRLERSYQNKVFTFSVGLNSIPRDAGSFKHHSTSIRGRYSNENHISKSLSHKNKSKYKLEPVA